MVEFKLGLIVSIVILILMLLDDNDDNHNYPLA